MKEEYYKQDEIKQYAIDILSDISPESVYGSDLHNELFNTDYYIIGTYKAKQWLKDFTFEAIETINEYEKINFGECNTDLSDPEKVVNMYVYIVGEQVLGESKTLMDAWDRLLTQDDISQIIEDLS
jgi:hypothetical protein